VYVDGKDLSAVSGLLLHLLLPGVHMHGLQTSTCKLNVKLPGSCNMQIF
jgi:hypothetical protein